MKRFISFFLALCLILGSLSFSFAEEEPAKEEKTYRHLDMGVYCTIYQKDDKTGKYYWVDGKEYGSVQVVSDFEIKSKYLSGVTIKRAWAYDGSDIDADDFQFNKENGDTWNIPVNSFDEFNPRSGREDVISYYNACAKKDGITNIQAKAIDGGISLSYSVKLETPKSLDAAEISRKYIDIQTVSKEVEKVIKNTVTKPTYTEAEKKAFAEEAKAHQKNYAAWMQTASTAKTKDKKREALNKANTELSLAKKYDALSKNNSTQTKTSSKVVQETVEEVSIANKDLERYENEIYAYWGGKSGLLAQAKVSAGSKSIKDALEKIFNDSYNNSEMKLMLCFVPIVIEFTKEEESICSKCDICEVDPSIGYCTKESCSVFGTEECGCYEAPIVVSVLPSSNCSNIITWTESTSHRHSHGKKKGSCSCTHTATFKAEIIPTATLSANKPNGNSTTFKSGYGFSVNGSVSVKVTKVGETSSHCGGKRISKHTATITAPESAEVRTSWTVKNPQKKTTQGKVIPLALSGKATKDGSSFVTKANPVSNYNKALIYTDVALKGTKEKPVKHKIEVYFYGGGVNKTSEKFCVTKTLEFTINGNMYEDDSTSDTI